MLNRIFAESEPYRAILDILVADDQDRRHLLGDRSADLLSDGLVGGINLSTHATFAESLRYVGGIVDMAVWLRRQQWI